MAEPEQQNQNEEPAPAEAVEAAEAGRNDGEFRVLDANENGEVPASLEAPTERPYNPEQFHDTARKQVAFLLLSLLAFVVVCAILMPFIAFCPRPSFDQFKSLLEVVLTPLLTLVSAATGFYFGSQKK